MRRERRVGRSLLEMASRSGFLANIRKRNFIARCKCLCIGLGEVDRLRYAACVTRQHLASCE